MSIYGSSASLWTEIQWNPKWLLGPLLMFIHFYAVWSVWTGVCVCLCLAMLSLHASFPRKMRKCLLAEWFPLFWKFLFFSPNVDSSYFTHAHKEKQEETWRFLTSWPSDMIESVLVPSQTKGPWKQRVSTWLGLHVAMDRGRREESEQSCHAQHLFIQTVHLLVWNEQA